MTRAFVQPTISEELRTTLGQAVVTHCTRSMEVSTRFFAAYAEQVALTCRAMAKRFHAGGRLLVFGNGGMTTDAQHIAVEFVHPVLVGKKALPALSLTNDTAVVTGITKEGGFADIFATQLRVLGGRDDIAIGLSLDGNCANVLRALEVAQAMGLLTIGIAGAAGGQMAQAAAVDHCFVIPSAHPPIVQETLETFYHILWEQVQLFLEQTGWLHEPGRAQESADGDQFSQLFYPFLHEAAPAPTETFLAEVRHSTLEKSREVQALRWQVCETSANILICAAVAMAEAFGAGKKLLTFGNGGSATDAQAFSLAFVRPPSAGDCQPLPALSLTSDVAVITALANDVGFEHVFARQLIAFGRPGDIALGISTSGNSGNLLAAFATAKRLGLLTIGLAGYNGGRMAQAATVDYCLVIPSDSVHRIQEVQGTVCHTLWDLVYRLLRAPA
jgi:D-sedoheptulose 7-phosphate isomerase